MLNFIKRIFNREKTVFFERNPNLKVYTETDPRAFKEERLVPTFPLRCISRGALKRVKHYVLPPESCIYCGADVDLVENSEVYGRNYGDWPYLYMCVNDECKSYVGLHTATDLPLGTLANANTRSARKRVKSAFIKKQPLFNNRSELYQFVAERMNAPVEEFHFAMFTMEQCHMVEEFLEKHFDHHYRVYYRGKKNEPIRKRKKRT